MPSAAAAGGGGSAASWQGVGCCVILDFHCHLLPKLMQCVSIPTMLLQHSTHTESLMCEMLRAGGCLLSCMQMHVSTIVLMQRLCGLLHIYQQHWQNCRPSMTQPSCPFT